MDYDQITADDTVGMVCLDLNSLIALERAGRSEETSMDGWFPIYDTMKGVRGELHIQVKLDLFEDVNRFKESSAGVEFLTTPYIPMEFNVLAIDGFVEELIMESDPEYHWSDTFRTNRSSNEARQRLLFHLSGKMRRLLGKKVQEMGCNAVVGYRECFDFEVQQRGIVVRAIGTACRLTQRWMSPIGIKSVSDITERRDRFSNEISERLMMKHMKSVDSRESVGDENVWSTTPMNTTTTGSYIQTATSSSWRPILSLRGLGNATVAEISTGLSSIDTDVRPMICTHESGILTLEKFPEGGIKHLAGLVSARSVKLLDNNDREIRDAWWTELRQEILSHAKMMGCNHIIGYSETTTISEDLCILSASGTAAVLNFAVFQPRFSGAIPSRQRRESMSVVDRGGGDFSKGSLPEIIDESKKSSVSRVSPSLPSPIIPDTVGKVKPSYESSIVPSPNRRRKLNQFHLSPCGVCHIPFARRNSPFPMHFTKCLVCRKHYVPEFLMVTTEPPAELWILGHETPIEAVVCREKKIKDGESHAMMISEMIPFIEYELHRQIVYKVKLHGLNSIFGIRFHMMIGESLVIGFGMGTGYFLPSLPMPAPLKIEGALRFSNDSQIAHMRDSLITFSERQRDLIKSSLSTQSYDTWPYREFVKGYRRATTNRPSASRRFRHSGGSDNVSDRHRDSRTSGFEDDDLAKSDSGSSFSSSSESLLSSSPSPSSSFASSILKHADPDRDNINESSDVDVDGDLEGDGDPEELLSDNRETPSAFVVEIDDRVDEVMLRLLRELKVPEGCQISCAQRPLILNDPTKWLEGFRTLSLISRKSLQISDENIQTDSSNQSPTEQLQTMLYSLLDQMIFETTSLRPVAIWGLSFAIRLPRTHQVEITVTALMATIHDRSNENIFDSRSPVALQLSQLNSAMQRQLEVSSGKASSAAHEQNMVLQQDIDEDHVFSMDHIGDTNGQQQDPQKSMALPSSPMTTELTAYQLIQNAIPPSPGEKPKCDIEKGPSNTFFFSQNPVLILPIDGELPFLSSTLWTGSASPLSPIHADRKLSSSSLIIDRHITRLSLHFIREGHDVDENGGLGTFLHAFLMEALTTVRSHATSLHGNAVISCHMNNCIILDNPVKSQLYCLLTITGDVVRVSLESLRSSSYSICK